MFLFLSAMILPPGKYQMVHKVNEAFKTDKYCADRLVTFWREMRRKRYIVMKITMLEG